MINVKENANFIWEIADLLRGDYKQSDYGKVILPLTVLRRLDWLKYSKTLSMENNLLFSDAIHATSCKVYGINHIATNDSDFDRVDFLKNWRP